MVEPTVDFLMEGEPVVSRTEVLQEPRKGEWVDDYGDDYGLRVEAVPIVFRSRRRGRRPIPRSCTIRLTTTATTTGNEAEQNT
jgi:hypothetical protein